jgi:predicted RNase H-like HicB family nuclease
VSGAILFVPNCVIEKEPEDDGYFAYSLAMPGCFSNGRTIEETRRNIREAVQQHVASRGTILAAAVSWLRPANG